RRGGMAIHQSYTIRHAFSVAAEPRHAAFQPGPRPIRDFAGNESSRPLGLELAIEAFQARKTVKFAVAFTAPERVHLTQGEFDQRTSRERFEVTLGKQLQRFAFLNRKAEEGCRGGLRRRFGKTAAVPLRSGAGRQRPDSNLVLEGQRM